MPDFAAAGWLYEGLLYIAMGVVILIVSKFIIELLTPYKIDKHLTKEDNAALGVTLAGYYCGVVIIYISAVLGESEQMDSLAAYIRVTSVDLLYAVFGIVALNGCRLMVDKLVLYKFSTTKEIVEDHNVGTGAVEGGAMVATAMMIAGAIHGDGSLLTALAFWGLGQLLLVIFGQLHQLITPYDIHDEIEKDNVAAGSYMGFNLIALGIIVLKATSGDFVSWSYNLINFAIYGLVGFCALVLLQKISTMLFLGGICLEEEIARDRNMNIAWICGSLAIGIATLIFFLL